MDGDLLEIKNIIEESGIDVHKIKDARKYTGTHKRLIK